jgi:hypothetical protein
MKVMQTGEALPVIDAKGRLVGILNGESVADFFLIRQALGKAEAPEVLPTSRMMA